MNTTATTWLRRSLVALAASLSIVTGSTVAADAYTSSSQGSAQAHTVYQVRGSHHDIGTPHAPQWMRRLSATGPIVSAPPATYARNVRITWRVSRWNGSSWALQRTYTGTRTLAAGGGQLRVHGLGHDSQYAGHYHVTFRIDWLPTVSTNSTTPSLSVSMSHAGDYACNTTYSCSRGQGWIYLS